MLNFSKWLKYMELLPKKPFKQSLTHYSTFTEARVLLSFSILYHLTIPHPLGIHGHHSSLVIHIHIPQRWKGSWKWPEYNQITFILLMPSHLTCKNIYKNKEDH